MECVRGVINLRGQVVPVIDSFLNAMDDKVFLGVGFGMFLVEGKAGVVDDI